MIRVYVHKLIAQTFVSGFFEGATVDHIDGNRTNNQASNLRWISREANTALQNAAGRGAPKGQYHPLAKLRDADIPLIFRRRNDGLSLSQIAREFHVSVALIAGILKGTKRVH